MLKLFLITIIFLAIAIVIFSITQLVKKNGKFPQTHIGRNKVMAKKGISCAQGEERRCRSKIDGVNSGHSCSSCC